MSYNYALIVFLLVILGLFPGQGQTRRLPQPKTCFTPGKHELPADVGVNEEVICIPGTHAFKQAAQSIPDVQFGETKFSEFSLENRDPGVSALNFAMSTWPKNGTLTQMEEAMEVYGAINAGIRSVGVKKNLLTDVKNVGFYLGFIVACKTGNDDKKTGFSRNFQKTEKNCLRCTKEDKEQLLVLKAGCVEGQST